MGLKPATGEAELDPPQRRHFTSHTTRAALFWLQRDLTLQHTAEALCKHLEHQHSSACFNSPTALFIHTAMEEPRRSLLV